MNDRSKKGINLQMVRKNLNKTNFIIICNRFTYIQKKPFTDVLNRICSKNIDETLDKGRRMQTSVDKCRRVWTSH